MLILLLQNLKMSIPGDLTRSDSAKSEADSVTSFLSDEFEEDTNDYTEAPHDIKYTHDGKEVRVMKKGETVPGETKYKRVSETEAIKFRSVIRPF